MQERRRNILIGLFVLGGLICLAILILLFGAFPNVISGRTYRVTIYFANPVEDLPADTDVSMIGKRIGRVASVSWRGGQPGEGVEAALEIDGNIRIPSNATAEYREAAMGFGRSRVQIVVPMGAPAPGFLPEDGQATIMGAAVGQFERIVPKETGVTLERTASQIGKLADALTPAARDLHELLKNTPAGQVDTGQAIANLSSVMQRLDAGLRNVNDVIGTPQAKEDLVATIANVRAASEQLKGAIVDIQHFADAARQTAEGAKSLPGDVKLTLADLRSRIDSVAQNIITNSDNLNRILVGLDHTVTGINQGEGTLGHLVKDNRMYEALVLTAQRLAATTGDLQALVKSWQAEGVKIESLKLR